MSEILDKLIEDAPEYTLRRFDLAEQIGEYIYSFLINEKMNQEELADRLGMKPSQLNRYVNGESNLTLETISKIEIGLGHNIISIRKPLTYNEGTVQTWQVEKGNDSENDSVIYQLLDEDNIQSISDQSTTSETKDEDEDETKLYSYA